MRTFLKVWIGQFISLMGSKLTEFALAFWAYGHLNSVTEIAGLIILLYLPNVAIAPLAGPLVDRWSRRFTLILSDCIGALCSIIALLLVLSDQLQIWHIYIGVPILAISNAIATPAYSAAVAQLVPQKHYGRANGMTDIPLAISRILTPILAAALVSLIQLQGVLILDILSFSVSLLTLFTVRFPKIQDQEVTPAKMGLRQLLLESKQSWYFIRANTSLFQLWVYIIWTYFTIGMFDLAFWLLILKLGSVPNFGLVVSGAGCGYLLGSLTMSLWGGTQKRIAQILWLTGLQGLVVMWLGIGVQRSFLLAAVGASLYLFADPIIMGSSKSIWQEQVPKLLQGRVFSLQLMFQRGAMIPAYAITGLLIDRFFSPVLNKIPWTHAWLEQKAGLGISLFLLLLGIIKISMAIAASRNSKLTRIDQISQIAI